MSTVTLLLAKKHLRVTHEGDDTYIQMLIDGLEDWVERHCNIGLTEAGVVDYLDGGGKNLWPTRLPIVIVASVYDEEAGETIGGTYYHIRGRTRILYDGGAQWGEGSERFRATYTGGFGGTVAVPAGLKAIVYDLIYRAYMQRGGASSEKAGDWAIDWDELVKGEVFTRLSRYQMGRPF